MSCIRIYNDTLNDCFCHEMRECDKCSNKNNRETED